MSYCRWSCDNMKSDVYAYESGDSEVSEYVVHVASSYYDFDIPAAPLSEDYDDIESWVKASVIHNRERSEFLSAKDAVVHNKKHAGRTFYFEEESDMFTFFRELRSLGYYVPNHAFESNNE